MLILGRVLCNCCGVDMGQLHYPPVPCPGDHDQPPHLVFCPACQQIDEAAA